MKNISLYQKILELLFRCTKKFRAQRVNPCWEDFQHRKIRKNRTNLANSTRNRFFCSDMDLPKQSRKPGDRRGDDDMNEAINDPDHRLNHVYQGSLRETGSTLEPFFDDDVYSSSNNILPPASCILLIVFSHMLALT